MKRIKSITRVYTITFRGFQALFKSTEPALSFLAAASFLAFSTMSISRVVSELSEPEVKIYVSAPKFRRKKAATVTFEHVLRCDLSALT